MTTLQHTQSVRQLHNDWASRIPQLLSRGGRNLTLRTATLREAICNLTVMGKIWAAVAICMKMSTPNMVVPDSILMNVSAKVPPQVSRGMYLGVGKQKLSI